jgi:DNA adenine methylase
MAETIIKRVGGKIKIREWIKSNLPPHSIYCEPFGGSFAVGFVMPKPDGSNYRLVYNDLDSNVYNMFRVLREKSDELINAISLTPYSREEFDKAVSYIESKVYLAENDMVEWARNYIVYNRQSMFGKEDGTWCVSRNGENIAITWKNLPECISECADFFKSVFVEHLDYKECIRKWDDEKALFYLDPPYVDVEKDFYHVNKDAGFSHIELFETACAIKGSCAISYYDSSFVRDLYKESLGFKFFEKKVVKHMQKNKNKDAATEVLIVKTSNFASMQNSNFCF